MPDKKFQTRNGRRMVLVVDDQESNRLIMGKWLEAEYDVIYAADGEEALQQMREHAETLSLVLLDLLMPVVSGFDVLKTVKETKEIAAIVFDSDELNSWNQLKGGFVQHLREVIAEKVYYFKHVTLINFKVAVAKMLRH